MANARSVNNKKRSATTKIQAKPAKSLKKEEPTVEVIARDLYFSLRQLVTHVKIFFVDRS